VVFKIHALDVLHDFWVPSFRMKIDAVPGITTTIRVTPTRPGDFAIVCAELCGLGHSEMRSTAHVIPRQAFTAWLQKKAGAGNATAGGATPPTGSAGGSNSGGGPPATGAGGGGADQVAQGRSIFTGQGGCGGCHALADAKTSATVGPDLGKVLKGKPPSFIMQSILNPNAEIAKGYPANVMPQGFAKTLTKDQIGALVAYLAKVAG
jgi:cytochrome c oxidase subunit 2